VPEKKRRIQGETLLAACASAFEGPEKKLEIILFSAQPGLRENTEQRWRQVAAASGAEILSQISSSSLDAYLLSESSLFVWEDRILMITCGRTVLLRALPRILDIVGRHNVAMVFYERKNLKFPAAQPADFEADAAMLGEFFPGRSYRLGPANADHVHLFFSSHAKIEATQDATLQILMSDLSADTARPFFAGNGSAGRIVSETGIEALYSGMKIDSHLFTPAGFSVNAVRNARYFTVHVTPQKRGSYTSFETNVIEEDYSRVTSAVVDIFRPERYTAVLTTSMDPDCRVLHRTLTEPAPGYDTLERSLHEFNCGYAVTFLNCGRPVAGNEAP
jgi:S-adenosylmethionine decarboxylase